MRTVFAFVLPPPERSREGHLSCFFERGGAAKAIENNDGKGYFSGEGLTCLMFL